MYLKLLVICSLIVASYAWLAPERCSQKKTKREAKTDVINSAQLVDDVDEIATRQHERLKETYKNHKFIVTPVLAKGCKFSSLFDFVIPRENFELRIPSNCSFHTYSPQLISSVSCHNSACELTHQVTTIDTYTAVEGYNWGVKVSEKATLFELIEVGGEFSTGATYSCTYNRGKTISDSVKCSDSSAKRGELQLFNVKSDMVCDFAGILFEREHRNGAIYFSFRPGTVEGSVTQADIDNLKASLPIDSAQLAICLGTTIYLNSYRDQVIDNFIEKLKIGAPLYNPLSDMVSIFGPEVNVYYYKTTISVQDYRRVIPFTTKNGDGVYKFACVKTTY